MRGLAALQSRPGVAARLARAAAALRERINAPLFPVVQARLESWLARAREALGPQADAAAWAEGRAMTPAEALAAEAV